MHCSGQDFTDVAILAYECGYTEDTVKQEMQAAPLQVRRACAQCMLMVDRAQR